MDRRFLRVPWTARRSNQSVLKEINSECSLEGLNLSGILFTYLFLFALGLGCCASFSLIAASGGCSLVVVLGIPIVMASLVAHHGLQQLRGWAQQLRLLGFRAQAQ